jgi:phosphonate transport system substrate-binding protein
VFRPFALLRAFAVSGGLLLALMAGCKSGKGGDPRVLHYAIIPSEEQMQDNSVRAALLKAYLTSQLHMPVEVVEVSGYSAAIEAMRAGKVDVGAFGPLSYIIASEKAGAKAIVTRGTPDRKPDSYNSILVVPKNSPIHSIADLKARAKSLTFAFVDPASTSGYLIPSAYLHSVGIDPEKDFGKVVFTGNHLTSIMSIKSGKVDAGPVMNQVLIPRLIELGKLAPDDLRVLWTSDPIPESPICVHNTLSASLQEKIRQAHLDMQQKDPALWKQYTMLYHHPNMTFVPIKDSDYDGLRKFAAQLKDVKFSEK